MNTTIKSDNNLIFCFAIFFESLLTYCKKLKRKWISDRAFYVTIADADIGSLKSLHTLFDKYLDLLVVKF